MGSSILSCQPTYPTIKASVLAVRGNEFYTINTVNKVGEPCSVPGKRCGNWFYMHSLLRPHKSPMGGHSYVYPHFPDEETEAH